MLTRATRPTLLSGSADSPSPAHQLVQEAKAALLSSNRPSGMLPGVSVVLLMMLVTGADECAHEVVLEGKKLSGGPVQHCIRQVLQTRLDEQDFVAVRVEAPHRFEAATRTRVFVYSVSKGKLVPRFLGSGFSSREVTSLFPLSGALGVETLTSEGKTERLRCVFDGFPLVCAPI